MLPSLGRAGLERAEIYFLDGARGMVETGDLLVPHYRAKPFFDKPPLTYWLMAASFQVFGPVPAAARLVAALAAIAAVAAVVGLGRALGLGLKASLTGGLVLATTHAFVSFGRIAMSDMLLTLFSTTAVALAMWPVTEHRRLLRAAALGVVLGLGFLTKGPVAVLFPCLGIAALGWMRGVRRLDVAPTAVTAVAFLVVGVPWFALIYARLGSGPLAYFFLRENLERFAGPTYDAQRPFWYYLPTYLAIGMPWSLFLPAAAARAGRVRERDALRGLLLWAALMLVPLSLSRGKIDYYLLPLLPALSLVVGVFLTDDAWSRGETRYVRVTTIVLGVLLLALALAPWIFPEAWRPARWLAVAVSIGMAATALAMVASARAPALRAPTPAIAAGSAAVHLAAVIVLVPAFVGGQPNAHVLADVSRELRYRPDAGFAFCSDPTRVARDVLFYERVSWLESCDELWAAAGGKLPFLLLVSEAERRSLGQIEFVREIGDYVYLPPTALSASALWQHPRPARLYLIANFETDEPVAMERWRKERKRDLQRLEEEGAR